MPLLSIYLKESKSVYYRDTFIFMFTITLFAITKIWNQSRSPSTDEWIKKMLYMHIMALLNHKE
jgi:hypothetical protein